MKIKKRYASWAGFFRGPKAWKLAWVDWSVAENEATIHVRPPFDRLFFARARLAHEIGHAIFNQGNTGFHHPAWHCCVRSGHALRLRRRHLGPKLAIWWAARDLMKRRSVTVE